MLASCTLPWTKSTSSSVEVDSTLVENDCDDSAFHEPEYSNPASYESGISGSGISGSGSPDCSHRTDQTAPDYQNHSMIRRQMNRLNINDEDFIPDYEEVDPVQVEQLRRALKRNSFHKEVVNTTITSAAAFSINGNTKNQNEKNIRDSATKERIMQALIFCIHKDSGCSWSGPLNGLKAHLNVCQRDALDCLNQCGAKIARSLMEDHMLYTCSKRLVTCSFCNKDFTGAIMEEHLCGFEPVDCDFKCGGKIQRNRLKAHQINTCSKRLLSCAYCSKDFMADTLQSHHIKCLKVPVPCPYKCGAELIRENVEKHLNSGAKNEAGGCTMINIKECVFHEAGCKFRGNEILMKNHLEESQKSHLDLMCALAHQQQDLIQKLSLQLEQSQTSYNGVLVWKIKDLKSRMAEAKTQDGLELVSAPFYTSQYGYKVQASLFLNGNGGGDNSHLSVYIKLLPGDYDSILKWPFRHTVSFTLLDQADMRKDACNIVESFIPDPTWKNFQRPSKEPDQLGFGFPKFVPHDMLNQRNYVRDDCMFIKIRVDPSRNVAV